MTSTSTTRTHPIDKGTARFLCEGHLLPSEMSGPTVVALSADSQALEARHTGKGFELTSTAPADSWADLFGVLPYREGRVALSESERGAWRASLARLA